VGGAEAAAPKARPAEPVIVIDAGHGGRDPGTISKGQRIREKEISLAISRKLASSLAKKTGARVYLTRSRDESLTLDQRDRLANWRQCDLFLSIHANATRNSKTQGVEIYYLNRATDEASRRLAQRENQGSRGEKEDYELILSDLLQTAATEESALLAADVKKTLLKKMKPQGVPGVRVKTALFYVLVGAKCPSLLIETGFLSNSQEARRLKRPDYQRILADAIAEGVANYLRSQADRFSDL